MPAVKEHTSVHIRWLTRLEMPRVLAIESESFGADAWGEEEFLSALRDRHVIGMVCEHGGKVVAYLLYQLCGRSLEILNLAVDPQFRRRGVASQCIAKLAAKLSSHRRSWITVNVSECDLAMQLFLRSAGFRATAVLKRMDKDEADAYRFTYSVSGWEPEPADEVEIGEVGGEG